MHTLLNAPSVHHRRNAVEIRHAAILVLMLAFGGCAAFSEGGISAQSALYRHAVRLGQQSGKGITIYAIHPEEFSQGSSFTAIRDATPSGEGEQLLRDQVLIDVTVAKTVDQFGLPTAISFASSNVGQVQHLAMFYKTLPRIVALRWSSLMDTQWLSLSGLHESRIVANLQTAPPSVQRLLFHEALLTPASNLKSPPELLNALGVTTQAATPPEEVDGHDYVEVANDLIAHLPPSVNNHNRQRGETALSRLEPGARFKHIDWRVLVINAEGPMGFGVPDGTLFLSDGLVQGLDDAEVAGVLAHLMGHERYQHARACARKRNITAISLLVGGALSLAGGGAGFFLIPTGGYLSLISHPAFGYAQEQEVEANHAAAKILSDAGIPPDALFGAMVKLSDKGQSGTLAFDQLHHLPAAALVYGLMLDAEL